MERFLKVVFYFSTENEFITGLKEVKGMLTKEQIEGGGNEVLCIVPNIIGEPIQS